MLEYIQSNKDWIFSGAGIAIISVLALYAPPVYRKLSKMAVKPYRKKGHFIPKGKGHAVEKYMVTDVYRFDVKHDVNDLAQLQLVESSIVNGCGFAGIHVDREKIVFHHYGFANNCLHAVIAPGNVLLDKDAKSLKAQSNDYKSISIDHNPTQLPREFLPEKYRKVATDCILVACPGSRAPKFGNYNTG